jgi:hypothetical protein
MEYARRQTTKPVTITAVSTVTPRYPSSIIEMPNFATDSAAAVAPPGPLLPRLDRRRGVRRGRRRPRRRRRGRGLRPVVGARARLVREHRPLPPRRGGAPPERRRHRRSAAACPSTRAAGSPASARPSPPRRSPRCASYTWQLRGQATGRQVESAKLGVSVNQGLFGHGSSVVVQR